MNENASCQAQLPLDALMVANFTIVGNFGPIDTTGGVPMSSDPICLSVQLLVGEGVATVLCFLGTGSSVG